MTIYTITRGRSKRTIIRTTMLAEARAKAYDILADRIAALKSCYGADLYFTSASEKVQYNNAGLANVVIYATYFKRGSKNATTLRVTIRCEDVTTDSFDRITYNNILELVDKKRKETSGY